MSNDKHVVIQDQIGRTIIGKVTGESETELTLHNPVFFYCQHHEDSGQIEVKTFPMFFMEILDKSQRDLNDWTFQKANIVTSNVRLESSIMQKYLAINTPKVETPTESPKVISINDL